MNWILVILLCLLTGCFSKEEVKLRKPASGSQNLPSLLYPVQIEITGLTGSVSLLNSSKNETFTMNRNGLFQFANEIAIGGSYAVSITKQPFGQECSLKNENGVIKDAKGALVQVICGSPKPVTVITTGLRGGTLSVSLNGQDSLSISQNGKLEFNQKLNSGATYSVSISSLPLNHNCNLVSASGSVTETGAQISINCSLGAYTLRGTMTYDSIPVGTASSDGFEYSLLKYSEGAVKPARRVTIRAMAGNSVLASQLTDDLGRFTLSIPAGSEASELEALLVSEVQNYQNDTIGAEACRNGSWKFTVADNTAEGRPYSVRDVSKYYSSTQNILLHAATRHNGVKYTERTGAVFNILDTLISGAEKYCEYAPSAKFPPLFIYWSEKNYELLDSSTEAAEGLVDGTNFTLDENNNGKITLLGKEDINTDEYDTTVIAHEFGHYLQKFFSRDDSFGGNHYLGDVLAPEIAFSEGYATSIASAVTQERFYTDTMGMKQSEGFFIDLASPPPTVGRSIYDELSVAYFLSKLYKNADSFKKAHTVLSEDFPTHPALTTLLAFGALYKNRFGGTTGGFKSLWMAPSELALPYNALCVGSCNDSTDLADFFDSNNDLGIASSISQRYPVTNDTPDTPLFWQLYRPLSIGLNAKTEHDRFDFGSYQGPMNKFGGQRYYVFSSPVERETQIQLTNVTGGSCADSPFELYLFENGEIISYTPAETSCPSVVFTPKPGMNYILNVSTTEAKQVGWDVLVTQ